VLLLLRPLLQLLLQQVTVDYGKVALYTQQTCSVRVRVSRVRSLRVRVRGRVRAVIDRYAM